MLLRAEASRWGSRHVCGLPVELQLTQDPAPRWGSSYHFSETALLPMRVFCSTAAFLHWLQILFASADTCEMSWAPSPSFPTLTAHAAAVSLTQAVEIGTVPSISFGAHSIETPPAQFKHCIILPFQYLLGPVTCEFLVSRPWNFPSPSELTKHSVSLIAFIAFFNL